MKFMNNSHSFDEKRKWKIISEYENVKNVYTLNEYIEDGTVKATIYRK